MRTLIGGIITSQIPVLINGISGLRNTITLVNIKKSMLCGSIVLLER